MVRLEGVAGIEPNPSAAGSGTGFDGVVGGLCFYALTSSANADIYPHIYLLSRI